MLVRFESCKEREQKIARFAVVEKCYIHEHVIVRQDGFPETNQGIDALISQR